MDKDLLELFSKVEISTLLLDAIKQVPKYAKFLKKLCTTRRRGSQAEQVSLKQNVSSIFQYNIAPKCEDRGTFAIPCVIGKTRVDNCILDIGAAINVIPYSIYRVMHIGPIAPTNLTIQLANGLCTKPEGILVDVLVHVGKLVFVADFYVMKTEDDEMSDTPQVLLGRPFMATAKTQINVGTGELSMEVGGDMIKINVYKPVQFPPDTAGTRAMEEVDVNAIFEESESRDDLDKADSISGTRVKKEGDPGPFTLNLNMCGQTFSGCIVDLGSAVNVIPATFYRTLEHCTLTEHNFKGRMANGSRVSGLGRLMDVDVHIEGFVAPTDFVVMEMEEEPKGKPPFIILGRPFIKSTKALIDMDRETLTLRLNGSSICFDRKGEMISREMSVVKPVIKRKQVIVIDDSEEERLPDPRHMKRTARIRAGGRVTGPLVSGSLKRQLQRRN